MFTLYKEHFYLMDDFDGDRHECEKCYYLTEQEAIDEMLADYDRLVHGNCTSLLLKHGFTARWRDKDGKVIVMMLYGILET